MSRNLTTVLAKGERGQVTISAMPIDPDTFFTVLPLDILSEIGACRESRSTLLSLHAGQTVESPIFSLNLCAHGREDPTLAITFDGAQPVLGAKFLEDLGLTIDSRSGSLVPSKHQGYASDHNL